MPRSHQPAQQFPVRLTQAQRKVVAEIVPKLADRLKLDERNQRTIQFTPAELKKVLKVAGVQFRAMILLGVNCGFGNHDVATLPQSALDLDGGWVDFPRPKTGIPRRAKLWPETVVALRSALARRPKPKDAADDGLVFVTKYGTRWAKDNDFGVVSKETAKLLKKLGLHRPGLNFYALRHTFRTVADESRDQAATDHVMGHAKDDMPSVYRERIGDDRLEAVAEHVRRWLFGTKPGRTGGRRC